MSLPECPALFTGVAVVGSGILSQPCGICPASFATPAQTRWRRLLARAGSGCRTLGVGKQTLWLGDNWLIDST